MPHLIQDRWKLARVIVGRIVGQVIATKHPNFHEGDIVRGDLGWQEYAVSDGRDLRKIDPALAPISTALGVLGMPGLTAYFCFLDITKPQSEESVVVSGAAGAVGSLVGQISENQRLSGGGHRWDRSKNRLYRQ